MYLGGGYGYGHHAPHHVGPAPHHAGITYQQPFTEAAYSAIKRMTSYNTNVQWLVNIYFTIGHFL